jgi:hypothetical protein
MKKLAIGCGIVLLLGMIGVTAAFYYVYYYVSTKTQEYAQAARQFAQIAELDKRVTNKASFHAPSNGELTEEAVRRFVAVQESMTAKLGPRIQELTEKSNELQRRQQAEHRDATPVEVIGVVKDLAGLILQAKNAQVEALNASHFSLDEYDWVRRHVYAAAGVAVAPISLDNLTDPIKYGASVSEARSLSADVPPRNKALVEPYLTKLNDWAPYFFFGL